MRVPPLPDNMVGRGNDTRDVDVGERDQPYCSTRVRAIPPTGHTSPSHAGGNNWCDTNTVRFDERPANFNSTSRGGTVHSGDYTPAPLGSFYNFKLTPPQFTGKKYEDPDNFLINAEAAFSTSGVPESGWFRIIEHQLSDAAAGWYRTIKSMGLSWREFCEEFADR